MAMQSQKSGLFAKLGNKLVEAHEKAKNAETTYGNAELPDGIIGGIAQLVDCKFDVIKPGKEGAGNYYFYAAGVVKAPTEHNGIPVAGLRTSIMEVIADTPTKSRKTIAEHVAWIYNELRKLGVRTSDMKPDMLEQVAEALKKAKPHTRFRTWKGTKQTVGLYAGKEPRVNHDWGGACEWNGSANQEHFVEDNSAQVPKADETQTPEPEMPDSAQEIEHPDEEVAGDTMTEAAPDVSLLTHDLQELCAAAEAQNGGAQKKLKELADAAGMTDEQFNASDCGWPQVVEFIERANAAGESPVEEPKEITPVKGKVYSYQVLDSKTKKPATDKLGKVKKPAQVNCQAVYVKNKTADLKSLEDGKTVYKSVAWSAILPA